MKSSQKYPLSEIVHVDEFAVKEDGTQARSYDTKKTKAVIAVKSTDKNKVKRVYVKAIDDFSAKSLSPIFEEHVSISAKIFTEKWSNYSPLKVNITLNKKKVNGKNFKEMHIVIHRIKSWIRTVPTHASKKYIQSYFDEFIFRINRSIFKETIFHKIIQRMIKEMPIYHNQIIQKLNI